MSRAEITRERLIAAAIELAPTHGFARLSAEETAETAGVARSTFYEHFGDREECFLAALDGIVARLEAEVSVSADDPKRAFSATAVIEPLVGFAMSNEAAARCLFIESLAAGPEALDRRDGLGGRVAALLARVWSRGEELQAGSMAAALMVVGGTFRLLAMRLRHGPSGIKADLAADLECWTESYATGDGETWQRFGPLGSDAERPQHIPAMPRPPVLQRGRHRLSAAEVRRNQRERIMAATAELSRRHGYRNITVTEITAAARVSRNVFYAEFRDREHAASEAHEVFFQHGMSAAATAFFSEREWPERVWAAGRALADFWVEHPANVHLSFVEPHAIGPAAIQQTYDRLEAFTLFLEEGYRQRPQNRELPRVISEALAAVMFEAAYAQLRSGGSLTQLRRGLPGLVYAILAPFLGVKEARAFVEDKAGS